MTILLLWTIAFFFASLFQALPISSNWDPNIQPQSEINEQDMYNALACTELVTDVVILIMPLTMIWRLRLKASKKWALSGVFLLGSLYPLIVPDEAFNVFLWTSIEPCLGIVAACLPVLGPLFRETRSLASVFNSVALFSRLRSRNRSHQSDIISEQKQPPLVHDGVDREAIIMTTIKSKSDMLTQCSETDSAEGITVNTAISQTQHDRL
ncbi:MAG: hypothetical protein LQ340_006875 [Diploschistes diacapsis]|nr:MAG: hypothetical protein LQ340_006875 [Diploschistes diacapsis]